MPKISESGGPTDKAQPGYLDLGATAQSPNVVANPEHPSEAAYNDAMTRHGTDKFSDHDEAVVVMYQAARKREADREIAQANARGTERDYAAEYSYPELQQLCRDRDLPSGGSTEVLAKRLQDNDADQDA